MTVRELELRTACMQEQLRNLLSQNWPTGSAGMVATLTCKKFTVQTILWSREFVIRNPLDARAALI